MEKMIACCGLDCAQCPAYIASKSNDDGLRAKTAAEWKIKFNFDFTPQMINCHGCHATDGVQIGHCAECQIRGCAKGRNLVTCANCSELESCPQLKAFTDMVPQTRENLIALRA